MPNISLMGKGCLLKLGEHIIRNGFKKCLIVTTNGGNIGDYKGLNKSKKPQLPLICINTTAGTVSEMIIFSIIDEKRHILKMILVENITPLIAINDPELMVDMPKGLTTTTVMDALTHAIEASYVSTAETPIT